MKNFKTILSAFVLLFLGVSMVNAASVFVQKKQLTPAVASNSTGIVRIVFTPTTDFVNKEIAVILHNDEAVATWDASMAAVMLNYTAATTRQFGCWEGTSVSFVYNESLVPVLGNQVALWIEVDPTANTYSTYIQLEGDDQPTKIAENYLSRKATPSKGNDVTALDVNYCTLWYNDASNGPNNVSNPSTCVTIDSEAEVVIAVEPFNFGIANKLTTAQEQQVSIYPTVVDDVLTIQSEEAIRQVAVLSLNGQALMTTDAAQTIDVAQLNAGIYMVKVTTAAGQTSFQKIMKK